MKKIIPVFALLPLLVLVGCNQNPNPNNYESTNAPSVAPSYTNSAGGNYNNGNTEMTSNNPPQMSNTNTPAGTNNSNGQ